MEDLAPSIFASPAAFGMAFRDVQPIAVGSRIVVVGTTGSGKTTFSKRLSAQLEVPHLELDSLYWGANWTPVEDKIFYSRVQEVIAQDRWIIEGDYDLAMTSIWQKADTIIWLDYPLPLVVSQVVFRTFIRILLRTSLWGGNKESFRSLLSKRHSILKWVLFSHHQRRHEYPKLLTRPEYQSRLRVRLTSHVSAKRFLRQFNTKRAQFFLDFFSQFW